MTPDWALLTKLKEPVHKIGGLGLALQGYQLDCDNAVMPLETGGYNVIAMPAELSETALGILFNDASQASIEQILTYRNSVLLTELPDKTSQTSRHDIDLLRLKGGLSLIRPNNAAEAFPLGKVRRLTLGDYRAGSSQSWAAQHLNEISAPVLTLPLGSSIETSRGMIAIEKLRSGDTVATMAGPLQVKMVSLKRMPSAISKRLHGVVTIAEASLIGAKPEQEVSLFSDIKLRSSADMDGRFTTAKLLSEGDLPSPSRLHVHVLLSEAGIVEFQGLQLLTLLPATITLEIFDDEASSTLLQAFPALGEGINASQMPLARKVISDEMAQKLIAAHLAANKSFFDDD